MVRLSSRAVRIVGALVAVCGFGSRSAADDRTADTRRFLDLLTGARIAYREAFEDGGAELASLTEIEEARLLLTEASGLNARLHLVPPDGLATLAADLDAPVGSDTFAGRLDALAAEVTAKTGIAPETFAPAPASASRGRELYRENCAGCHGVRGTGDGADAARASLRPADFTSEVFMRREMPLDFFIMITVGNRRGGMPEWSQGLSVQQRWDLVAYLWGMAHDDADRAEGSRLWAARCTSCHGSTGTGVAGAANDLTRPGSLTERTDRMLFVGLFRGPHAAANAGLTDTQRWQVVGHARAVSLGGLAASDPPPPPGS